MRTPPVTTDRETYYHTGFYRGKIIDVHEATAYGWALEVFFPEFHRYRSIMIPPEYEKPSRGSTLDLWSHQDKSGLTHIYGVRINQNVLWFDHP